MPADIRRKIEIGCYQGSGTAAACRSAASAPTPTRAAARARKKTVAGKKKAGKKIAAGPRRLDRRARADMQNDTPT